MADQLIKGVDFAPIPTRDIERAVEFYGETLGMPRAVYMPERGFAEFEPGDVTINIYNPQMMGMEHRPNQNPYALHVDDVHSVREQLEAKGVEFNGDTFDTGVCHMAFFSDPDGNPLMLHHRYAPRTTEN
jgi:predicted enzyme related to lactoylglutathione lyase